MLYENDLDVVLQEIVTGWDIPGLAVGIVEGEEIVSVKGFGVQSLATQAPMTPDSVFCVQSVSKCFVATAAMQLVERGQLDLDAPIVQYLPYFQLDDERYRQITLRQILSHTSGMPDMDEREYIELVSHPERDDGAAERYVRGLRTRKLLNPPGERFRYSNIAYNVLGDLLAKVTGKSFEDMMRENILLPAGMSNSTFMVSDISTQFLAVPHLRSPEMRVNPAYPYHRADAPASFLHTTVLDMCHWAITCLKRGSYLGQRILSSAGYELMWTSVAERGRLRPSLYEEMGLGWTLGHLKDAKTVCHGGAGFGGTAFFLILPEKNCAAVVLCNEESDAHFQAALAAADALTGQKPRASKVSWMVPISRAMAKGGIAEAYAHYPEIKAKEDEFYFGEDELLGLSLQLLMAKQIDLAIEVLAFNIHVYPEHIESYLEQAKLVLEKGETARAKEILLKALSIKPAKATIDTNLTMKPQTTEDIFELLDGHITSSALGAAMELGLFWLIAEKPLSASGVAQLLSIPLNRCHHWLQLLCGQGLLEERPTGYSPSVIAQETILNAHSQATWAFLAREERERFLAVRDLAVHIGKPISTWEIQHLTPPNYFQQILASPDYAAYFTRMLYEIHVPLAEQVAHLLDLHGVKRLLDVGGGSGVISFALLRKQPRLAAVVVDVENVCRAGRTLALENGLEQRITYVAANFLEDDLPTGFDMVLLCDTGQLSEAILRKVYAALNPGGRLVIVEQFAPDENHVAPSHQQWAFLASLEYPTQALNFSTADMAQTRLRQAGFQEPSNTPVPYQERLRWNMDWTVLDARK